jgi:hypothetical protein
MMRQRLVAALPISIAVVAVAQSGCTTTFPNDLTVISIEEIHRADLTRVIGRDAQLPMFATGEDFLVVRIGTHQDVVAHAVERNSLLAANAWFCDSGQEVATPLRLYVQGREVRYNEQARAPEPTAAGIYEYDTIHLVARSPQVAAFPPYDLGSAPQDICLQVAGSNMVFAFESNVVRVTKEQIKVAIGQ